MKFTEICEKVYNKYNRLQEALSSSYIKAIKRALLSYAEEGDTYDQLESNLINIAWSANSTNGIISDTPEIADLNDKITDSTQLKAMLMYACDTLNISSDKIARIKKTLLSCNEGIIESFIYAVQFGRDRVLQNKFDFDGFCKGARRKI